METTKNFPFTVVHIYAMQVHSVLLHALIQSLIHLILL